MRDCRQLQDDIWDAVEAGELPGDLLAHAKECDTCRGELARAESAASGFRALRTVEAPECSSAVMARLDAKVTSTGVLWRCAVVLAALLVIGVLVTKLHRSDSRRTADGSHHQQTQRQPPRPRTQPKLAQGKPVHHDKLPTHTANGNAASMVPGTGFVQRHGEPLVVVIFAQAPVFDETGHALSRGDRLPAGARIRTGKGGRVTLVTRKGSELHLDSGSDLALASDSTATISQGRLYCANRDKEIARIDTPAGHVRLLGTVVNTAVVRRDAVAVTVVEGRVRLSNQHGWATLEAGERSMLVARRSPKGGTAVDTRRETCWYHGRGAFQSDFGEIAYTIQRPGPMTEVWVMGADGGNRRRVRSYIGRAEQSGPWMPGERWLCVRNRGAVWSDGGAYTFGPLIVDEQKWLLDAATGQCWRFDDLPAGYLGVYQSIAPDPNLVAFTGWCRPAVRSSTGTSEGLYVYDRTTEKVVQLLDGSIETAAAWAPDSRRIAISCREGHSVDYRLQVIDTRTKEVRDLNITGAGACFSPDGKKLAYCSDFKSGKTYFRGVPDSGSVFVLNLAPGSKPIRVSPADKEAAEPRWSPDGTRILYREGRRRLCVVSADGKNTKQIYECEDGLGEAAWSPSGDAIYVMNIGLEHQTVLVAADGAGVISTPDKSEESSVLPREARAQTDAAGAAVSQAVSSYAKGWMRRFEGNPAASRRAFQAAADQFARLVWDYPLSGLGSEDTLRYADAAAELAQMTDSEMLVASCSERSDLLVQALWGIVHSSSYAGRQFPKDTASLRELISESIWGSGWLRSDDTEHARMLTVCPVSHPHGPVSFVYSPPKPGELPETGKPIVSCPLHRGSRQVWREWMSASMVTVDKLEPGKASLSWDTIPYAFENVGAETLTVTYNRLTHVIDIQGKARLLPTPRVYQNERISLPEDEGAIARDIDSAGPEDWGKVDATATKMWVERLEFCRAVAQFEAGLPVTHWKTIDGEPAIALCNSPVGSCGAMGTELRFELCNPNLGFYQLKPSGRFRVFGKVRVMQTKQTCKNGWIDKNGNVISTEK